MLNELGMKMCKICGSECSWVFCIDCEKLIGNGIDDMKADLAQTTDREKRLVEALDNIHLYTYGHGCGTSQGLCASCKAHELALDALAEHKAEK